jgi:hypothetical protein
VALGQGEVVFENTLNPRPLDLQQTLAMSVATNVKTTDE